MTVASELIPWDGPTAICRAHHSEPAMTTSQRRLMRQGEIGVSEPREWMITKRQKGETRHSCTRPTAGIEASILGQDCLIVRNQQRFGTGVVCGPPACLDRHILPSQGVSGCLPR